MISYLTTVGFALLSVSTLLYCLQLIFNNRIILKIAPRLAIAAFAIQSIYFGMYFNQAGYPFLITASDSYLFTGWILAGIFLILRLKDRFELSGVLLLPVVLVLYTLAHFTDFSYTTSFNPALSSPFAAIHIVLGFLSFSVFLLAFVIGLLFLFQEFQLKRKKIFKFFDRFPSLEVLDRLHYKALKVGFSLLTLGIISGSAWAKDVKGVYFFNDPKQLWTLIAWLAYAFFFQARFSAGWRGRRGVLLSIIGFAVIVFTFVEVQHQ